MRHLKPLYLFFICVIFHLPTANLRAQHAPKIQWQKCIGGDYSDRGKSIIQTRDGNYTIVGSSDSTGELYSRDVKVAHLDSDGVILWQVNLGGTSLDDAECIIQTSDGGYAVAANTLSNDRDVSGNHGGGGDVWIVKLDSTGNIEWQKCLGGSGSDVASSIIESTEEGRGFLIVGQTNSNDGDVSGRHPGKAGYNSSDVWIVKLSSSGVIQWQKCLGGSGDDEGYSVIQTSDHGYAIAGSTDSPDGDVSGLHISKNNYGDAWVIKLSGSGMIQWQKCLGGSNEDHAHSIIQTSDKGFAITGSTLSNDGDVSGNHITGSSNSDLWVVKLSFFGAIEWQKCYGGSYLDAGYSIVQTHQGDFVVAGVTISADGDVSGNDEPTHIIPDCWVVKINSSGALLWQKRFGGTQDDGALSIILTSDGGMAFTGNTESNDGDVSGNNSIILHHGPPDGYAYDIWVVKLESDTITATVTENNTNDLLQKKFFKMYPNPSSEQINFDLYPTIFLKKVEFYDIMGRQQFPSYTTLDHSATVDVHNLVPGTYIARLTWIQHLSWLTNDYQGNFALPFIVKH